MLGNKFVTNTTGMEFIVNLFSEMWHFIDYAFARLNSCRAQTRVQLCEAKHDGGVAGDEQVLYMQRRVLLPTRPHVLYDTHMH